MRLSFYRADGKYCGYLRQLDRCVPYVKDGKDSRPFMGIVLSINEFHYYAPLSSPKPKHLKMKNQIDFIKINGGKWGVINFNNMIPVHSRRLARIEPALLPADTQSDRAYRDLLTNQLTWCNSNRDAIYSKAEKLHRTIVNGKGWPELNNRCCDFLLLESKCREDGVYE